jgi:hypothetical protein
LGDPFAQYFRAGPFQGIPPILRSFDSIHLISEDDFSDAETLHNNGTRSRIEEDAPLGENEPKGQKPVSSDEQL